MNLKRTFRTTLFKNDKLLSFRTKQSHLHHVIASGTTKSLCGEANSSHADERDEFASSFLLAMTNSFIVFK